MKNFWCEIDLNKLEENVNIIKNSCNKKIIGVVKGNAYGLGIEGITDFLKDKVDYFAVADMEEAKRVQGDNPILLLSPLTDSEDFKENKENIIYTIDNEEILMGIDKESSYKVHIYVDTGMNRMGIKPERLAQVVEHIKTKFPNIIIDGVYTHLHNTKNVKFTLNQIDIFKNAVMPFKGEIPNIHCLNSSGFLNEDIRKAADFTNLVRAGNILYGYEGASLGLKKIFSYCAKVVNTCHVKKGELIGYGSRYKAKKDMEIGILGFGNIEHFGFSKDVKHNVFYDILKVIYHHTKKIHSIFFEGRGVEIVGKVNMNVTIINMEGISKESVLKIDITPILADSNIPKKYKYNE